MTQAGTRTTVVMVIGAAVLAVSTLVGCDGPDSGTVTDRRYTAAYVIYNQVCVARTKTGVCISYVPQPVHHPEECELQLERQSASDYKIENGWRTVPCAEYAHYAVGDKYPR